MRRLAFCFLASRFLFGSCGGDDTELAQVEASLLVPRILEEDLGSIEIFLFETDMGEPRAEDLVSGSDRYKSFDWERKETYPYPGTSEATMEGIPDRGNVWRFYARGLNDNGVLIGHGATAGLYDINPDSDTPVQVSITINAVE